LFFTAYASPVSDVIEAYTACPIMSLLMTQFYIATNADETTPTLDRLARCTAAVKQWFLLNDLQQYS